TFMPPDGAEARADLVATLTRITHERFVADEVGDLLDELEGTEDETDAALVRLTRREWERARHVPAELAAELAHAAGGAVAAWDKAKAASDFASFVPHLERQLELKHRYIECFPEMPVAYDVLLDEYEEGMTTAEVQRVFDRLKEVLLPLIAAQAGAAPALEGPFPVEQQHTANNRVLDAFGYHPGKWRLDETPHPFASKPGAGHIRLTTHPDAAELTSLFSTMHEFGHGVYEFDIDERLGRTPLAHGTSSAIHESQS